MNFARGGLSELLKEGTKHISGVEGAVLRNLEAVQQLSTLTKTSMGPNGMNKMVINHLEKLFVTHDAATILKEMEVIHPAAKLIVLAAQAQEIEVCILCITFNRI
jgi:T-complex protein 1 subunit theta